MSRWMKLDNAALIFPAVRRARWVNVFRLSVTLTEPVDPRILQEAVDDLLPRFPSIYVRLGTGFFWYFLETLDKAPTVIPDYAYPLTHMSTRQQKQCCFRVLYFQNRIAVEFFHVLTDGTGGLAYLKSLTARYEELHFRISPDPSFSDFGIGLAGQKPSPREMEDAFHKCSGPYPMSRKEATVYRLRGRLDDTGFMHLTCGVISTSKLLEAAHRHGGTITSFLSAVMIKSIIEIQDSYVPKRRQKPVKVTIPVDLRKVFGVKTMRNFALVLNIGVDPRLKAYSIDEICREYSHQMALEVTPEKMAARIAANVIPSRLTAMRLTPLFIKNIVMRMVYDMVGETKGCLNISNLGRVTMPPALSGHIDRFDFIIGVQASYPNNCSVVSFGDTTCINMIRNITDPELERRFFSKLVELGVPVLIESNENREDPLCTV